MYTGEVLFGLLEEGDHLAMIEKVIGSFSPDQVKQAIAAGVDPSLFADDGRTVWPNADTVDSALTVIPTPCPSCTPWRLPFFLVCRCCSSFISLFCLSTYSTPEIPLCHDIYYTSPKPPGSINICKNSRNSNLV
jgi:hypothetical protein